MSSIGAGAGGSGIGGAAGSSSRGIRGRGNLGTGLEQGRVVALVTLADLEGIGLALLDVVTGGPGESTVLGLGGDDFHIAKIAGVSLTESQSNGLVQVSSCR